jgi:peptidoglycan hydrolase CwlO-like protein
MPRPSSASPNKEILEAALHGLELQRDKLEQQIAEVRSLLGTAPARRGRPRKNSAETGSSAAAKTASATRKKRTLSPEARKRIAAAQKKRWASFRKSQG